MTRMRNVSINAVVAACLSLAGSLATQPAVGQDKSYLPDIAPASPEAKVAMKSFKVAPGTKVSLFAAEPLLANPVAFGVDFGNVAMGPNIEEVLRRDEGRSEPLGRWLSVERCAAVDDQFGMLAERVQHDGLSRHNGNGRACQTVAASAFLLKPRRVSGSAESR